MPYSILCFLLFFPITFMLVLDQAHPHCEWEMEKEHLGQCKISSMTSRDIVRLKQVIPRNDSAVKISLEFPYITVVHSPLQVFVTHFLITVFIWYSLSRNIKERILHNPNKIIIKWKEKKKRTLLLLAEVGSILIVRVTNISSPFSKFTD